MSARRQEPSDKSSASPESWGDVSEEETSRRCQGDMTKIPTSDTLVGGIEELKENRAPKAANESVSANGAALPAMHRVVIRRQRVSSPSPKMSPILSMTRRSQIPQQLLSPIALSMSRRSLGGSPQDDRSPGREKAWASRGSRTPPVPRRDEPSHCRTPPVRSPLLRGGYTHRFSSQPSRHSLGAERTPPVPSVRRSSSQGRGEAREAPEARVRVATVRDPLGHGHVVKDEAGRTHLMHAARRGDLREVVSLLQEGCFVDDIDSCKCTALMYAATYGHVAIAKCLVQHHADVNAQSHDRWTPLIAAAYNGHVAMAEFLLSSSAHLEYCDERGWTALMHVAFNGRLGILKCLLQRGALVHQEDKEGRTALVYAAFSGHLDSVKLLLAYSRLQRGPPGAAGLALMFAADKGHLEIVRAFLDAGAATAQTLHSAMELAISHGHHHVAQLLRSAKV